MHVFSVIPARGGSKGLPRKNIVILDGKPLIAYTIQASCAAKLVTRTFVSTEDDEIAAVAAEWGADVLKRPPELATDFATSNEVIVQSCQEFERNWEVPEFIVYLQATDVFRRAGIIDRCIETLIDRPEVDAAFAAFPDHKNFWSESSAGYRRLSPYPDAPRQVKPPIFREDTGIACATRFSVAKDCGRLGSNNIPVVHDDGFSYIDIHCAEDLWLAELVVQRFKGTGRYEF